MLRRFAPLLVLLPLWALACAHGNGRADEGAAATAYLTIERPAHATCDGGHFHVDGVMRGRYPVRRLPIAPGEYVIGLRSRGDCAGHGDVAVELKAGEETTIGGAR